MFDEVLPLRKNEIINKTLWLYIFNPCGYYTKVIPISPLLSNLYLFSVVVLAIPNLPQAYFTIAPPTVLQTDELANEAGETSFQVSDGSSAACGSSEAGGDISG